MIDAGQMDHEFVRRLQVQIPYRTGRTSLQLQDLGGPESPE